MGVPSLRLGAMQGDRPALAIDAYDPAGPSSAEGRTMSPRDETGVSNQWILRGGEYHIVLDDRQDEDILRLARSHFLAELVSRSTRHKEEL